MSIKSAATSTKQYISQSPEEHIDCRLERHLMVRTHRDRFRLEGRGRNALLVQEHECERCGMGRLTTFDRRTGRPARRRYIEPDEYGVKDFTITPSALRLELIKQAGL